MVLKISLLVNWKGQGRDHIGEAEPDIMRLQLRVGGIWYMQILWLLLSPIPALCNAHSSSFIGANDENEC